jgi:hypothetical protein
MHIFPHIGLWQLDFFVSLAVFWATSGNTSEFIYTTFGAKAQNETNNKKDSSQVVNHFTECLKSCIAWFNANKQRM